MRVWKITSSISVTQAEEFVLFVLEYSSPMDEPFSLGSNHFRDACLLCFEIIDDVPSFISGSAIDKDGVAYPLAQRVQFPVGRNRWVLIVDNDIFSHQFNVSIFDFSVSIKVDYLSIDIRGNGISCWVGDRCFDITLPFFLQGIKLAFEGGWFCGNGILGESLFLNGQITRRSLCLFFYLAMGCQGSKKKYTNDK